MDRTRFPFSRAACRLALFAACAGGIAQAQAQTQPAQAQPAQSLRLAFEAAWARQPEAQALQARREAAQAQMQAVQAWTPAPTALELSTQTDRLNRNQGARELAVGLAIPLWLPGERARSLALAQAESGAVESHSAAARLRVAGAVREAWWAWQRSRAERDAAHGQFDRLRRIAADVARRVKAGDLSRADQHQADAGVAAAEAAVAQAEAAEVAARLQLRALTGLTAAADSAPERHAEADAEQHAEPRTEPHASSRASSREWADRTAVAEAAAALAATQTRASPELVVTTTRERGAFGQAVQQTFTVGLRLPFGAAPKQAARLAAARAEVLELQAQLALDGARIAAERESAQARLASARKQVAAAERRAQLARESRGFFDRSFQLGQTDLPTRLRVEAEAADAERQAASAGIESAAAVSALRQALGLLPQ